MTITIDRELIESLVAGFLVVFTITGVIGVLYFVGEWFYERAERRRQERK